MTAAALPAIVADADADTHAGGPEADAGARTVIPVPIAALLDISLARRVIVRILHDDAAATAGPITLSILVADQANLLHEIRVCVLTSCIKVGGICAACQQGSGASQERDR